MKKKEVTVIDPAGLHARPVGIAVNKLREFDCEGYVFHNGREVSMDSVVQLMALNITQGTTFIIATEGKQEDEALYEIEKALVEFGFIEDHLEK